MHIQSYGPLFILDPEVCSQHNFLGISPTFTKLAILIYLRKAECHVLNWSLVPHYIQSYGPLFIFDTGVYPEHNILVISPTFTKLTLLTCMYLGEGGVPCMKFGSRAPVYTRLWPFAHF